MMFGQYIAAITFLQKVDIVGEPLCIIPAIGATSTLTATRNPSSLKIDWFIDNPNALTEASYVDSPTTDSDGHYVLDDNADETLTVNWRPGFSGIATIFDAFWIGLTADFVINIIPIAGSIYVQITYLITGITLIGAGTAIYVGGDLGAGPRDGIMVGLEQLGFKIGNARTLLELVAFSIGFLLGGKIGICLLYTSPSPRDRG